MALPRELHVGVTSFAECRKTFQQVAQLFQEQFGTNEEPLAVGTHFVSLIGSPQQDAIDKSLVIDSGNITAGKYPRFTGVGRAVEARTIQASEVVMARIAGSTYSTVQDMQDLNHSAGWVSGGVVTDGGSNAVDITAGTGFIRATDLETAEILFFDWPALTGISVPSDTHRFVGIEYNAGTPQAVVHVNHDDFDYHTDFVLVSVVNELGGSIHIQDEHHTVVDHASRMLRRLGETSQFVRDEILKGLILSESGTRNVVVSTGALWHKLARFGITALDTNVSGSFTSYYRDGSGGWTIVASQTQWPNTEYDDNSGVLQAMTNNRFASLWFYLESDDDVVMVYPRAQFSTQASAENEGPPASVPDRIEHHGSLIGRILFKKSAATATSIETVFTSTFSGSLITLHSELNLDDGTDPHGTTASDVVGSGSIIAQIIRWIPPAANAAHMRSFAGGSTPAERYAVWSFSASGDEYLDIEIEFYDEYDGTSNIQVRAVLSAENDTGGTASIAIAFRRLNHGGEDLDASHTYSPQTASATCPSTQTQTVEHTDDFTNAQADGVQPGEKAILRIFRDVSGDSGWINDVFLHSVKVVLA